MGSAEVKHQWGESSRAPRVEGPCSWLDGQSAGGPFARPGYFTVSRDNKLKEVVDWRHERRKGCTEPVSRQGAGQWRSVLADSRVHVWESVCTCRHRGAEEEQLKRQRPSTSKESHGKQ